MANDFPVVLRQSRDDGVEPIRVNLAGPELPEQGTRVDTEQRHVTTMYPGNPNPQFQLLGPTRLPIRLKGVFNDRLSEDSESARTKSENLQLIVEQGLPITVIWGLDWLMFGFLVDHASEEFTDEEIGYEVTFTPQFTQNDFNRDFIRHQSAAGCDLTGSSREAAQDAQDAKADNAVAMGRGTT